MPDFALFSLDEHAGRIEIVTAQDPEATVALVQAKYPGATSSVVLYEQLGGFNRTKLLWDWMGTIA
jgi:hypothetical protein